MKHPARLVAATVAAMAFSFAACVPATQPTIGVKEHPGLNHTKGQILAQGSSASARAFNLYGVRYAEAVPGARLAYLPSGSGAGQEKFLAGETEIAASNAALGPEQAVTATARCRGNEAWHLPLGTTSMSMAFHLDGVPTLVLNSQVIARIYKAEILMWNDPAIAELNPGVALPEVPVTPVYRIDASGTTDTLQRYVQATSGMWNTVGLDYAGFGGHGAEGSTGVVGAIAATNGAIGYLETGYAREAKLAVAQLDFGAGPVEPSTDAVAAASAATAFTNNGHNLIMDTAPLYEAARAHREIYPLIMPNYSIVCSAGYDPEVRDRIKDMLTIAVENQGQELRELGYAPLHDAQRERVTAAVTALS